MVCQCKPHLASVASTNSYPQISSSASPPKPPNSPHTTRNPQSHLERSRPPSDSSCQANLPSMPSQKAQRPSPSTPAQANRRGKCGFLSSSVLARALGCELGRSHMGVVGLFSLMMRHGMVQMHNWANMLLRFSFSMEGESDVQYSPAGDVTAECINSCLH
jgi:hypothetical protein